MTPTGNDLLAEALRREGTEFLFFLMGAPLLDAAQRCAAAGIRMIEARHEQAAAMMAHAATRVLAEDLDCGALQPNAGDYVVIATRHKGDHQSMQHALLSPGGHVALIASRKRSRVVLDYLRGQGFDDEELARVDAPAGLALAPRTPEEIALSVLSEIVMLRRGGSGAPARDRTGTEPAWHRAGASATALQAAFTKS